VSFVKAKSGKGARDIRVVERGAATLLRGRLENITLSTDPESLLCHGRVGRNVSHLADRPMPVRIPSGHTSSIVRE
jgi:hypothetical protein